MRIVQLTPGSGGEFYCENCLRDIALVRAISGLGHDITMVPMYLPVQAGGSEATSRGPIFFGGINVYLQQKLSMFRKTPRWLDKLFDNRRLLGWVGKKAHMTSAKDLGQTTLSMLQGADGRQGKELDRLIEWLGRQENRCDIVVLSNILLCGLAGPIAEKLGVPVVSLLQDEDGFVDGLGEGYAKKVWDQLKKSSAAIDAFIAVSHYYGDVMGKRLELDPSKVHVVYTGVAVEEYTQAAQSRKSSTIGFLSQMCEAKGLDILVEAFISLKRQERFANLRLKIAGGKTAGDKAFIDFVCGRLRSCGVMSDVEFCDSFDKQDKSGFFSDISVLCVPERKPVAYGLYALESLAAGVPVAAPATGVFPELLEMTGGGVLYASCDADSVAKALEGLLVDDDLARELGSKGREVVGERFNIDRNAEDMINVFEKTIENYGRE